MRKIFIPWFEWLAIGHRKRICNWMIAGQIQIVLEKIWE